MIIKLAKQPTGNSCGPTCLYMIYERQILNSVSNKVVEYTIEDICNLCGTDWEVGTPPDRMEKGMKALNIKYIEFMCSPRPFELLDSVLDRGNVAILRTITHGVPHWIIAESKTPLLYNILDPWQGKIHYHKLDLNKIWSLRDYQFFEIDISHELNFSPYLSIATRYGNQQRN